MKKSLFNKEKQKTKNREKAVRNSKTSFYKDMILKCVLIKCDLRDLLIKQKYHIQWKTAKAQLVEGRVSD